MIVGGYTLDLYCDREACQHRNDANWNPRQYTAELGSRCRSDARRDGWLLTRDGKAYCPNCRANRVEVV